MGQCAARTRADVCFLIISLIEIPIVAAVRNHAVGSMIYLPRINLFLLHWPRIYLFLVRRRCFHDGFEGSDMIEHIAEMIESGVDSFKIEGRMKSIHYVATVVNAYRQAIDSYFAILNISKSTLCGRMKYIKRQTVL